MAYKKEDIEEKALEAIKEHRLTFFEEICLFVEPNRATLYNLGLDKLDTIKEALANNKLAAKKKMRNNWVDSDNPTLQIAAYRLYSTDEELAKLTSSKHEFTGKDGGPIKTSNVLKIEVHDFSDGSKDQ